MSHLIASAPAQARARARAFQDRTETDRTDHDNDRARSRLWTLIEALAYAGAYIDPSGILAVERLRQAKEEEERRGAR
jgi:hypothetical protein